MRNKYSFDSDDDFDYYDPYDAFDYYDDGFSQQDFQFDIKNNDTHNVTNKFNKTSSISRSGTSFNQNKSSNFSKNGQSRSFINNQKPFVTKKTYSKPSNFKKLKTSYKPVSDRYLTRYQKINIEQLQIQQEFKNLRKWFYSCQLIKQYPIKIKEVVLNKSLNYPVIFFEYEYQGSIRTMHIRQLIRMHQDKFKLLRETLLTVYDRLYSSVDPQYQDLNVFTLEAAVERHVYHFKKQDLKLNSNKLAPMFYYTIDQNQEISFILFNWKCISSQFQTSTIKTYGNKHPVETQLYMKFQREVKNLKSSQNNQFDNEQMQNDYQTPSTQVLDDKQSLEDVQKKLSLYLSHNNEDFEKLLQNKNSQFLQIQGKDSQSQKLINLANQIQLIHACLQNYKQVTDKIRSNIHKINSVSEVNVKKMQLKMALKKLIIASKQLKSRLPILAKKKQIFQKLNKQNLIVLQGQTGSGKSTQLPQILCEYFNLFDDTNSKSILITQPRKLATRTIAERVRFQMEDQGSFVDYMTSIGKQINPSAKIIFKLDRFLLDELIQYPLLEKYCCLVIDQAHERTISIDIILGLLKQLLSKRKDFKIIVTSASLDTQLFEKYFNTKSLKIQGTKYPVITKYVQSMQINTTKKIQNFLINQILEDFSGIKQKYRGHILIFCSEVSQINQLCDFFKNKLNENIFKVLPLHGKLTQQQQKLVFINCIQFKIIFASRIAQTSITIEGIKVVIDPGYDRTMIYDQKYRISSMKLIQISQSSAKQRTGRAGRTQESYCFRLYSIEQFKRKKLNKTSQIKNMALDSLVLRLKTLKIKDIFNFSYLQRPDQTGMRNSLQILKILGCLDFTQDITKIGMIIARLQIEPFLARAIIQALILQSAYKSQSTQLIFQEQILDSVIKILCMLVNAQNLFRIPQQSKQTAQLIKFTQFSHEKGDFLFLKFIYDQFIKQSKDKNNISNLKEWVQTHYLNLKTLYQARDMNKQIKIILKQVDLEENHFSNEINQWKQILKTQINIQNLILGCLSTSFCMNLCLYSGNPFVGYTLVHKKRPLQIYGTSNLSNQGIYPKWIFSFDLIQNVQGKLFCKIANEVSYEFLKRYMNKDIFKKFDLQNAQKQNPFYKELKYDLPSLLFNQIQSDYKMKDFKQQISFFNQFSLTYKESINQIIFYLPIYDKDFSNQNQLKLKKYLEKIEYNAKNQYHHNYVANIFVSLKDGFKIGRIDFSYKQTIYQINDLNFQSAQKIKKFAENNANIQSLSFSKMNVFIDCQKFNEQFKQYLILLQKQNSSKYFVKLVSLSHNENFKSFKFRSYINDKRMKIPQSKVLLHFFAGQSENSNIFMTYNSHESSLQPKKMLQILKKALTSTSIIRVRGKQVNPAKLNINQLKLTRKGNGINYFTDQFDEHDMKKTLINMKRTNGFMSEFVIPHTIKKFREPVSPYCFKENQQWQKQIQYLLDKAEVNSQCKINVWGYYTSNNCQQHYQKAKVDMHAQIISFDSQSYIKLKNKYDGKSKVLGCEKLHISSMYDQTIAVVFKHVFNNLYDQYSRLCKRFQNQSSISFDHYTKIIRGKQKVFMICKSQNRQDLLKPARIIGNFFIPKLIPLTQKQFRFLNSGFYSGGEQILNQLQQQYDYRIYFNLNKSNCTLKLFCDDSLTKQISKKLKENLNKRSLLSQRISYRGKNLNILVQYLKQKIHQIQSKEQKKQSFLTYQIIFFNRLINLTADSQTFLMVKQFINKLSNIQNAQCKICYGTMDSSYRLYNCSHVFCKFCLNKHIQQSKALYSQHLRCPQDSCESSLNINDVKTILNQEQFQKLCDVKVSRYVENHPDYLHCFTPGCEQIFERKFAQKNGNKVQCQLCGKLHCIICMEQHKNYTCLQWKNKKQGFSKQKLAQFGIKICPKCRCGLMKSEGCNHMTCICGAHICWNCLAVFQSASQCYKHLTISHQGIGGQFDFLYRDNHEFMQDMFFFDHFEDDDEEDDEDDDLMQRMDRDQFLWEQRRHGF